ncbi:hypothetical protein [uncultured Hymenobacter sp.]|uniref:hypothetical protein n=1 Tax=uncultured Hymenobacter sp. TaxID=170016 RepID=UPI0035CC7759
MIWLGERRFLLLLLAPTGAATPTPAQIPTPHPTANPAQPTPLPNSAARLGAAAGA